MEEILILKESIKQISHSSDLFNKIKKIDIDYKQENFIVFYLNSQNELIDSEVLFKGGLTETTICPKTLFRKALLKNSNSLIVAHNHPSNDLNPSECDKVVYDKLKECGKLLKLNVIDFIIFNEKQYYSLLVGV